jgi:hypothetical protein
VNTTTATATLPWYRQRWPWLLMAGPAIVVVAGVFTTWLAMRSDDGLVADDYYKRGLAINQSLDRASAAAARDLRATVDIADDGTVDVALTGRGAWPATVRLRLAHPTHAGADRVIDLPAIGDGRYAARMAAFQPGRWRVVLEGDGWKLPAAESTGRALHVVLGQPID